MSLNEQKEVIMKEVKQNETSQMSLSKARKIERKKEIARNKKNAILTRIISICVAILACVGIVSLIGYNIYRSTTRVKPSSNYSANITENGLIENVAVNDYVTVADYKNITVPLSEVEFTDEEVEKEIQTILNENSELSTKTEALIEDGNKVNIDYVGTIDGVEFEGGNSNEEGYDLTIGSGDFIEGFEEQLIGYGVGDEVSVEVTFPADYNNAEVAGKDAVFAVIINGIYEAPDFTDEFVKENLADHASTADEYRQYIKDTKYDEKLTTWITSYLMDNSTVSSYPENYMSKLKSIKKYQDQSGFAYMQQLYAQFGSQGPASFEEYIGMSEVKYDKQLAEDVKLQAKQSLVFQSIYEAENLSVSSDDYGTYFDEETQGTYDSSVTQYGKGYTMQQLIGKKVVDYVKGLATVQ